MRKLQIIHVRRVTTFGHRDDVVNAWAERMGVPNRKVHGLAANAAHLLGRIDPLFVFVELGAMGAVLVGPIALSQADHILSADPSATVCFPASRGGAGKTKPPPPSSDRGVLPEPGIEPGPRERNRRKEVTIHWRWVRGCRHSGI